MLSNREVEQYRELGYLVVPTCSTRIAGRGPPHGRWYRRRCRQGCNAYRDLMILKTHILPSNRGFGASRHRTSIPFFAELTRNPRITAILAQLLGPTSACTAASST